MLSMTFGRKILQFPPPLTLQPIVENAVRHGIMMREEGGTVVICTSETEFSYIVTIHDDGIGFDTEAPLSGDRSHIGDCQCTKQAADDVRRDIKDRKYSWNRNYGDFYHLKGGEVSCAF